MFAILISTNFCPVDMPPPVVRSPLGLPLGDRGLLPLLDTFCGVGAGLVARGPYTLPSWAGLPVPPAGGPAPLEVPAPRGRSPDSDHRLGGAPRPPNRQARADGDYHPPQALLRQRPAPG